MFFVSIDGMRHPVNTCYSTNPLSDHVLAAINPAIDIVYDYGKNKSGMIDSMYNDNKTISKLTSSCVLLIQNALKLES